MALEHRWNKLLVLRAIMLKSKNNFEIINSFFYCEAENFSEHPRRVWARKTEGKRQLGRPRNR